MNEEELLKLAKETSKKYIKDDGVFYVKLSDGRLWCPSLQVRGTRYDYQEPSLKKLQDQSFKQDNFVAIDFEIAYDCKDEKKRYPCQLGAAIVRDGKIIESLSYIIRPPFNKWSQHCIDWHSQNTHLTPDVTENEREFDELWPEINALLENQFIIAHNAKGTEIDILEKCLDSYDLPYPNILGYLCTKELLKRGPKHNSLDALCEQYGIDFNEDIHHDAEQDAIACAKLFLAYINGVQPTMIEEPVYTQGRFDFGPSETKEEQLHKRNIILPEIIDHPDFINAKIVLTGDFILRVKGEEIQFSHEERKEVIKPWIEKMGAKVTTGISGKTDIVIQGENPGKQDKIAEEIEKGHDIKILDTEYLNALIQEKEIAESNINKNNPLYKRRYALLGNYSAQQEKMVKFELNSRGAIANTKKEGKYPITRTTHYCILFDGVSDEDIAKIDDFVYDGYHIIKVPFYIFEKLLEPELGDLYKEQTIKRNLKITKDFLIARGVSHCNISNSEIFLGKYFNDGNGLLSQIIGNLGGYANREIYDETQFILLSDSSVKHLINGEFDETIDYIEKEYNKKGESLGLFTFRFITESDFLKQVKNILDNRPFEDITDTYYRMYLDSCK